MMNSWSANYRRKLEERYVEENRLRVAAEEREKNLRAELDEALEHLAPFALMSTAWDGKDDTQWAVEVKHQSILVRTFRDALDFYIKHTPSLVTDANYAEIRAEVDRLIEDDPEPGSLSGRRLMHFASLLQAYEKERFPIGQSEE